MSALGLVRAGDLLQEPGALPGVAGGQHGEGGAGQEPGGRVVNETSRNFTFVTNPPVGFDLCGSASHFHVYLTCFDACL